MDIATIIGLLLAFGMMAVSVVMGGGNFASFWDTASVLMVIGGTIGAILICFPLRVASKIP
ncbi:MAG: motility protein A, partial [Pirellulaceae bacterium]|nr:motility protein A [Pirellulaceae bacterium]